MSPTNNWARDQFENYHSSVAFIEVTDSAGNIGIGTCFHVGEGTFVTARHVVADQTITALGFDDALVNFGGSSNSANSIVSGPHFHSDPDVDVAVFKCNSFPKSWIPLGSHFDDFLGLHDLVLHQVLLLGYPPIPFSDRPALVATAGEVNALIDKYTGGHPHFIVSTMARGGFSGGPALVAYNVNDPENGTAALGLVTESLNRNGQAPELGYMAILTVEPIYTCLEKHGLLPAMQNYGLEIEPPKLADIEAHINSR